MLPKTGVKCSPNYECHVKTKPSTCLAHTPLLVLPHQPTCVCLPPAASTVNDTLCAWHCCMPPCHIAISAQCACSFSTGGRKTLLCCTRAGHIRCVCLFFTYPCAIHCHVPAHQAIAINTQTMPTLATMASALNYRIHTCTHMCLHEHEHVLGRCDVSRTPSISPMVCDD